MTTTYISLGAQVAVGAFFMKSPVCNWQEKSLFSFFEMYRIILVAFGDLVFRRKNNIFLSVPLRPFLVRPLNIDFFL